MWPNCATRLPKIILALIISLALGLLAFYKGQFKPYKNIWLLLFLAYIPFNFLLTPQLNLNIFGLPAESFWVWKSFLFILVFFIAHIAIASHDFKKDEVLSMLNIMVWVGLIISVYAFTQTLGFEQFFIGWGPCATLGNTCLSSSFIALTIPIALYLKRYFVAIIMISMVFFINSQVAYGSMIVSLMFLVATKSKKLTVLMTCLFLAASLTLGVGYFKSSKIHNFVGEGGRFKVSKTIIKDLKTPIVENRKYSFTGFGLGSFPYIFHSKHPEKEMGEIYKEAHNDYLELWYNTGFIGIGLFLAGLFFFIKQTFSLERYNRHLIASFLCALICAGGLFIFQLGAHVFYIIVITGLLLNSKRGDYAG